MGKGPGSRSGAGLAADSARSEAVMFGGETPVGLSAVTQVYNETTNVWKTLHPAAAPSPRTGFGFASDPRRGSAVLFGGLDDLATESVTNSTWVFNFGSGGWTNVSGAVAPAARQDSAFAIDSVDRIGLLFGGWSQDFQGTGQETFSDTWELNLSTDLWSRVPSQGASGPPALHGSMMTWDASAGVFDLLGGCYPCSNVLWHFNLSSEQWTSAPSLAGAPPPAVMLGIWTYDPDLPGDVLFGGTNGVDQFNETILFLPAIEHWVTENVTVLPPARSAASSDWLEVPGNATLLMAGGTDGSVVLNETWRLGLSALLSVQVTNASDGLGITDAFVQSNVGGTHSTDARGYVNLSGLPSEEVDLTVSAPGYASTTRSLWLSPGGTTTVSFPLVWLPPSQVDVLVLDSTGPPSVGAQVNVTIPATPFDVVALTNAAGWANFTDVPSFQGQVSAWRLGDHGSTVAATFEPGQTLVQGLTLIPLVRLDVLVLGELPNGTTIRIPGATVTLDQLFLGFTITGGTLQAPTTALGPHSIGASAPYFESNSTIVALPGTGVVHLTVRLTSAPAATIDVTVLDSSSHQTVPVAQINFSSAGPLPSGVANFSRQTTFGILVLSLAAGNYTVRAWAPGYEENDSVPVQWLQPGQVTLVTILVTPRPLGVLDTIILDSSSHQPIGGANVTIATGPSVVSDRAGWANFSGLAPG
ncbi:MAG: carboxypeptidase-like regulatory domain-containing protein, partial [Thermoplasmata archaeon]|nr:carboxypeptidase-like regulatory domain-containing protein [Thermoplasmata archaeon]